MSTTLLQTLQPLVDLLKARWSSGALADALTTGHKDLDALTGGGRSGQMWCVNGQSGAGKTTFVLGLARHAAIRHRAEVRWLTSVEDPAALTEVLLAAEARVPLHHLRVDGLSDDDWGCCARAMHRIGDAPLTFDAVGESEFLRQVEALQGQHSKMLVIDALSDPLDGDWLLSVRKLTRALNLWTVVIAGDRQTVEPDEVDRAQARAADLVMWVKLPEREEENSPRAGEADIRITRSRVTPISTLTVAFQGHYGRFLDMTPAPRADERLW